MKIDIHQFSRKRERRGELSMRTPYFLTISMVLFTGLMSDANAADWKKAYRAGDYTNAYEQLDEMVEKVPDVGTYNRGCALYRQKDFQGAEKLFGEAAELTEEDGLKQRAFYNRGTALLASSTAAQSNRVEIVDHAIGHLEKSLELNPADRDAKQNLERALNLMISGRLSQAQKLVEEADQMLTQGQAKSAKENYTETKKVLAPVVDDFSPGNATAKELTARADQQLELLQQAVAEAKEDMENAKHAIDMYEYQAAAEVMTEEKPTRKWAFDLDEKLGKEFQQLVQNNQNVINIIFPPAALSPQPKMNEL